MFWVRVYTFLRLWKIRATFPSKKVYPLPTISPTIWATSSTTMDIFLKKTKNCLLICEKHSPGWVFRGQWQTFWNLSWGYSEMCNWYAFYSIFLTSRIILYIRMNHKKLPILDNFWLYKTVSFKSFNLINIFVNWGRSYRLRIGQIAIAF